MQKRILFLAIGLTVFASSSLAQPRPDHLLCYRVRDSFEGKPVIDAIAVLQAEFTQKECRLVQPIEFCVPATKTVLRPPNHVPPPEPPGQPLNSDFICYTVQCPNRRPPPSRTVTDQFASHKQTYSQPTRFCVPARKGEIGQPCQQTPTGGACGGSCPANQQCVSMPGVVPPCRCLTACTGTSGQCTGQCLPNQRCQALPQGCFCVP